MAMDPYRANNFLTNCAKTYRKFKCHSTRERFMKFAYSYNTHLQSLLGSSHCMPFCTQHAMHMAAKYLNPDADSLKGKRENPATKSLTSATSALYFKLMTGWNSIILTT